MLEEWENHAYIIRDQTQREKKKGHCFGCDCNVNGKCIRPRCELKFGKIYKEDV